MRTRVQISAQVAMKPGSSAKAAKQVSLSNNRCQIIIIWMRKGGHLSVETQHSILLTREAYLHAHSNIHSPLHQEKSKE